MTQRSHRPMQYFAAIALLGIGVGLALDLRPVESRIQWVSLPDAFTRARESGKPVFIDVTARWCRPCVKMDRTVFSLDSIRALLESSFVVARVDIDDASFTDQAKQQLDIEMLPSFVILTPDGLEWKRNTGYLEPSAFAAWLRNNSAGFVLTWPTPEEALARARQQKMPVMVVWVKQPSMLQPTYRLLGTSSIQQFITSTVVPAVVVGSDSSRDQAVRKFDAPGNGDRCLLFLSPEGTELKRLPLSGMMGLDPDRLLDSMRAVFHNTERSGTKGDS